MEPENISMQEGVTAQVEQPQNTKAKDLAIPMAIVIAGLAIAAAIFFGGKGTDRTAVVAAVKGTGASASTVDPVAPTDHVLGSPNAKVVIVEYSDTECPFCKMFHPTLQKIVDEYGKDGRVAWVYRHYPLPFHSKSPKEAEATECANKLGGNTKFWEYLSKVFEVTPANNQLDLAELPKIAQSVGLDVSAFNKCLAGGEMKAIVDKDLESGSRTGLQGTPYSIILVNGKAIDTINGAQPYEVVKSQIEQALK